MPLLFITVAHYGPLAPRVRAGVGAALDSVDAMRATPAGRSRPASSLGSKTAARGRPPRSIPAPRAADPALGELLPPARALAALCFLRGDRRSASDEKAKAAVFDAKKDRLFSQQSGTAAAAAAAAAAGGGSCARGGPGAGPLI